MLVRENLSYQKRIVIEYKSAITKSFNFSIRVDQVFLRPHNYFEK
jgi:hypothetical protein